MRCRDCGQPLGRSNVHLSARRCPQHAPREPSVSKARALLASFARRLHTNPPPVQLNAVIVARATTARLAPVLGSPRRAARARTYLKVAPSLTRAIASSAPSGIGASVGEASRNRAASAASLPSRVLPGAPTANPGAFKMSGAPPGARSARSPPTAAAMVPVHPSRALEARGVIVLAWAANMSAPRSSGASGRPPAQQRPSTAPPRVSTVRGTMRTASTTRPDLNRSSSTAVRRARHARCR